MSKEIEVSVTLTVKEKMTIEPDENGSYDYPTNLAVSQSMIDLIDYVWLFDESVEVKLNDYKVS